MRARLTIANWANLLLALAAFGFFVANQVNVFGGEHLQLTGTTGKYLLTGFLALGLLVQLAKIAFGHHHWFEALLTAILLAAHIAAELTIWYGSQVFGVTLPVNLPQLIIGFYWVLGPLDLLAVYGPRELSLFSGRETSEEKQARKLRETEQALIREQTRREVMEELAQRNPANSAPVAVPSQSKSYRRVCPICGDEFVKDSKRGAINALNAHKAHCTGVAASPNGHHAPLEEEA